MNISLNWLKDYVKIKETPEKIADILTSTGLEVTKISEFKFFNDNLIVGKVLSCHQHPNASKLKITKVDIGTKKLLNIVCGASNVREKLKVVMAPVNTELKFFDGTFLKIKKTKIRGEVSEGMICAPDEIGLNDKHDNIIELDTDLLPGTPINTFYNTPEDTIFQIDITPNRTDALYHIGVARDIGARLNKSIEYPKLSFISSNKDILNIKVKDKINCIRYCGIVINNVKKSDSPLWLQSRLKAIGLRPINSIVDITNFVLHEMGQPLHAYDFDKIENNTIIIQENDNKHIIETIDNQSKILENKELVIKDENKILCLAGIIGSKNSCVTEETKNIFLESAIFKSEKINQTVKQLNLNSDSSYRFQRGVDPNMCLEALKRAASLILSLSKGEVGSKIYDFYPQEIKRTNVKLNYSTVNNIIGENIPTQVIKKNLKNLEIVIEEEHSDFLKLSIPTYRKDVTREIDVIEEILRIYGYEEVTTQETLKSKYLSFSSKENKNNDLKNEIMNLLVSKGFFEIYTNSLTNYIYTTLDKRISSKNQIIILNPLSEHTNSMRQSLLFSGLEIISDNIKRQNKNLQFFEFGTEYALIENTFIEDHKLSLLFTEEKSNKKYDSTLFQKLKSPIYNILSKLGIDNFNQKVDSNKLAINIKDETIAEISYVERDILDYFKIDQQVVYASIEWDKILKYKKYKISFEEISKFPIVLRDLSLILEKNISFQQVKNTISDIAEKKIIDFELIDTYEDEKLGKDKKTYTLRFTLQDKKSTLKTKVIDRIMNNIINTFESKLKAIINKE